MADFKVLDDIGFSKLFYYRKEVAKYRGLGLSDEEVEEMASDILLEIYLTFDWEKYSQDQFCRFCKIRLHEIMHENRRRFGHTQKKERIDVSRVVDTTLSADVTKSVDDQFLEKWDSILHDIFNEGDAQDERCYKIAKLHFLQGLNLVETAEKLGFKSRQAVHRHLSYIRKTISSWVVKHKDRIYSDFDVTMADRIMDSILA